MNLFPLFTSNPSFPMTVSICAASPPNKILCSRIFSSPPPNKVRFFSFLLLMEKSFFLWGEKSLLFFGHEACGILVLCPGIHLAPHALEAQSPHHRTTRKSWSLRVFDGGLQPCFVSPVPEVVVLQVPSSAQMSSFYKDIPCWFRSAHGVKSHLSSEESQSSHKLYLWCFFENYFW